MNGINDHYHRHALIKAHVDNNKNTSFWCVANILENVRHIDISDSYVERKFNYLFWAAYDLLDEKVTCKLNPWDIIKTNAIAFLKGCIGSIKVNEDLLELFKEIKLPNFYQREIV